MTASAWSCLGYVTDMTTVQRVKMNSTAVRVHSYAAHETTLNRSFTSSSAVAEKPRCRVGKFWVGGG